MCPTRSWWVTESDELGSHPKFMRRFLRFGIAKVFAMILSPLIERGDTISQAKASRHEKSSEQLSMSLSDKSIPSTVMAKRRNDAVGARCGGCRWNMIIS